MFMLYKKKNKTQILRAFQTAEDFFNFELDFIEPFRHNRNVYAISYLKPKDDFCFLGIEIKDYKVTKEYLRKFFPDLAEQKIKFRAIKVLYNEKIFWVNSKDLQIIKRIRG